MPMPKGYTGPLTPDQVAAGMNCARENARRLLDDATLLLEANRHPSAAALAILSIEESGKLTVLRRLAAATDDAETLRDAWRDYRTHTKKNVMWTLPNFAENGARSLDDFAPLFAPDSEHAMILDLVKQIALYTDCYSGTHWSSPAKVIDADLARSLVEAARVLATDGSTAAREIELWIKHMSPIPQGLAAKKEAILAWHREMQSEGLASDDGFEKFVRGEH